MVWLPIGNRDYGFTDARPSGRVFAVTGDYAEVARNHCAATMLTNAVVWMRAEDAQEIFREVHAVVGNGPVLHLERKANRYLQRTGLPYVCEQLDRHLTESTPERLVQAAQEQLAAGMPVGLLVAASPLRWHWVLALPEEMNDGAFTIHDSWHARQLYQYTPDHGSRLMAVCLFRRS